MKKNRIMELVNDEPLKSFLGKEIIKKINTQISEFGDYEIRFKDDVLRIYTEIKEGLRGEYLEIAASKNKENNYRNILITKRQYEPNCEEKNGIQTQISVDLFTEISSDVYNNDKKMYSSWYSDDNVCFGVGMKNIPDDKESIAKYFEETSPKYQNGILISGPKNSYAPFFNFWQRYGNTNVFRSYGRTPMSGKYSEIGITFDNNERDQKLLEESYGTIYCNGKKLKYEDEADIIVKVQEIFNNHKNGSSFDHEGFNEEFNSSMYEEHYQR